MCQALYTIPTLSFSPQSCSIYITPPPSQTNALTAPLHADAVVHHSSRGSSPLLPTLLTDRLSPINIGCNNSASTPVHCGLHQATEVKASHGVGVRLGPPLLVRCKHMVQWSEDMIKADPFLERSQVRFRLSPWVSNIIARDHLA